MARLVVLGAPALGRAETPRSSASAVRALAQARSSPRHHDRLGRDDGRGALATSASIRLFALPTGASARRCRPTQSRVLGPLLLGDDTASRSLVALGSLAANAIFAPSPSAARANENDPALATRPSDEPFVAVRFGCDDPPYDPATDPALPASYSAAALSGKAECRRAPHDAARSRSGRARSCSALGPLHREEGPTPSSRASSASRPSTSSR